MAGVQLSPLMSVEFFDGQRREMIAAIRVIAGHLAAEVGKAALDDRVLNAMANVPRHARAASRPADGFRGHQNWLREYAP